MGSVRPEITVVAVSQGREGERRAGQLCGKMLEVNGEMQRIYKC